MTLDFFINEMRPAVEQKLQEYIELKIPNEYSGMKEMLRYHLGWDGDDAGEEAQGKRIRSLLLLLSSASTGMDWHTALPAAAAVELLHNFSLIHDDIQDKSSLRRGRPTLWVKWGIPQAINAGDLMFTLAQLAMLDMGHVLTVQTALEMAEFLNDTCIKLTGGQFLDLSYEAEAQIPIDAYWPMIAGKTASLLRACSGLGALAAGLDRKNVNAYADFGFYLGEAFQVLDDYLGIWGNFEILGKSIDSDLVSGKKTLPVLFGLQKKNEFYRRWLQGSISADEVPYLADLLTQEGAREYTQTIANQLTQKATDALDYAVCGTNEACLALKELGDLLLKRKN